MKKGFTIIELLVVIAIIGILLGLVAMAANGALKNARGKRASAMRTVLQQAVETYYAQNGEWPETIRDRAKNMNGKDVWVFENGDVDAIFREVVKSSVGANAQRHILDASGLFVADSGKLKKGGDGCSDNHGDKTRSDFCGKAGCANGVDFSQAVKKGKSHISVSKMAFGYQGSEYGKFCRYWITYNARTDSVSVSLTKPKQK